MAIDPRNLKPSELCRLLNSTDLGEVINERQLYRHRSRAGYRIGDGRTVDLLRYAAWLMHERHVVQPQKPKYDYDDHRQDSGSRNRELSLAGRDIGGISDIGDLPRRTRASAEFRFFCESYFPQTFHLAWSDDHLKVITKIERAVLQGGLFAMAMPRGSGKALALDTPLPTPAGWTYMADVRVGDTLFDEQGQTCRVTHVTPIQLGRPCYRVTFSDGESIVCDADHQWTVEDRWSRRNPLTLTTETMRDRVVLSNNRNQVEHRYRLPVTDPLALAEQTFDIDPYLLGYWLGDGSSSSNGITVHVDDLEELRTQISRCRETCRVHVRRENAAYCVVGTGHRADPDKERRVRIAQAALACHVPVAIAADWSGLTDKSVAAIQNLGRWKSVRRGERPSLRVRLRAIKVLNDKHIPVAYLRSAPWQRLALLQGLMDADGSVNDNGRCELTLKADGLGEDVADLLSGLGIKWTRKQRFVKHKGRKYGPYLRYHFSAFQEFPVFRLKRKRNRLNPMPNAGGATRHRQIVSIESVPSVAVRCIQVDAPSHQYLAGRKMVPTHNSTLAETACLWAVLNGHREFVCLIGSDEGHAMDMLESIKTELDGNDLLAADYPEVCGPIQALEGIANRCSGQLYNGARTHIGWTAKEIILPSVKPVGWPEHGDLQMFVGDDGLALASGAIIKVAGITGRIRGMKFKRADGKTVRPSLVVLDDPQTDESARSLSQCANRESILAGAVLGLSGPGKKISGIMPCTVIRPGDMADSILDRDLHPEWNGERTRMVDAFPTNEKLWDRYAEIRAEGLRAGDGGQSATEFYREHREEMDAGAVVAWRERFNHDELSAIQHAMNLKLQDEAAFFAEYQNEPIPEQEPDDDLLTADQIAAKLNGHDRGRIPIGCNHLTMFIDVQQKLLFYVVAAWESDFTGYVVDYGTYPDQNRPYFTLRDARRSLAVVHKRMGLEGSIYAGLEALTNDFLGREWPRDDGAALRIDRCLVDANWGSSTDVVYQFCRQSKHAALLLPSHGRFVGASSIPFSEYKRKQGDRVGHNWRIPNVRGKRAIRHVLFDTNYWKSFVQTRLSVAMGDRGCLSLFGRKPATHRALAEQLTAEYRIKTEGRGRTVDEWKIRPDQPDNHWLDGLVGCAVAASMQGAALLETSPPPVQARQRIKLSNLRRRK